MNRLGTVVKRCLGVLSALISLFSLAMVGAAIGDIAAGDPDGTGLGILWGLTGFFVGTTALAGWGALKGLRDSPRALGSVDSTILELAARSGGRVTATDIARTSDLSLEDGEAALAALVSRGWAEPIVTEGGVVIYQVKGMLGPQQKRDARDILDD